MPDDPVGVLGDLLNDMAERAKDYTAIVQSAAERNAAATYDADQAIADMLKVSGLVVRDSMAVATMWLNALGASRVGPE